MPCQDGAGDQLLEARGSHPQGVRLALPGLDPQSLEREAPPGVRRQGLSILAFQGPGNEVLVGGRGAPPLADHEALHRDHLPARHGPVDDAPADRGPRTIDELDARLAAPGFGVLPLHRPTRSLGGADGEQVANRRAEALGEEPAVRAGPHRQGAEGDIGRVVVRGPERDPEVRRRERPPIDDPPDRAPALEPDDHARETSPRGHLTLVARHGMPGLLHDQVERAGLQLVTAERPVRVGGSEEVAPAGAGDPEAPEGPRLSEVDGGPLGGEALRSENTPRDHEPGLHPNRAHLHRRAAREAAEPDAPDRPPGGTDEGRHLAALRELRLLLPRWNPEPARGVGLRRGDLGAVGPGEFHPEGALRSPGGREHARSSDGLACGPQHLARELVEHLPAPGERAGGEGRLVGEGPVGDLTGHPRSPSLELLRDTAVRGARPRLRTGPRHQLDVRGPAVLVPREEAEGGHQGEEQQAAEEERELGFPCFGHGTLGVTPPPETSGRARRPSNPRTCRVGARTRR